MCYKLCQYIFNNSTHSKEMIASALIEIAAVYKRMALHVEENPSLYDEQPHDAEFEGADDPLVQEVINLAFNDDKKKKKKMDEHTENN